MLVSSNKYSILNFIDFNNALFYRKISIITILFILIVFMSNCSNKLIEKKIATQQEVEALRILQTNLQTQPEWVKVHTAEFLLWSGYPEGVKKVFLEEEKRFGDRTPYRIGIWRVLAQAETKTEEKEKWVNKIIQAFINEFGEDRIHAAETLAKLKISPLKNYPDITKRTLDSPIKSLSLYTRWSTCFTSRDSLLSVHNFFFDLAISKNEDSLTRSIAVYVIRQINMLETEQWNNLALSALSEPKDSDIRINLLNAAFVCVDKESAQSDLFKQVYKEFLEYRNITDNKIRIKLADGLAENGQPEDIMLLSSFLKTNDFPVDPISADLRAFASYAILKISNRWKLN